MMKAKSMSPDPGPLESTQDVAKRLDATDGQVRDWMWAHGFDPFKKKRTSQAYLWRKADVDRMVEERLRWGFFVQTKTRVRAAQPHELPDESGPGQRQVEETRVGKYDYLGAPRHIDFVAAAERRAALRAQLDAAPVNVADIDYLSSRAGERRPRRGSPSVGPTGILLAAAQAKT